MLDVHSQIIKNKSLDPGKKHAGMTAEWDSVGNFPFYLRTRDDAR